MISITHLETYSKRTITNKHVPKATKTPTNFLRAQYHTERSRTRSTPAFIMAQTDDSPSPWNVPDSIQSNTANPSVSARVDF